MSDRLATLVRNSSDENIGQALIRLARLAESRHQYVVAIESTDETAHSAQAAGGNACNELRKDQRKAGGTCQGPVDAPQDGGEWVCKEADA